MSRRALVLIVAVTVSIAAVATADARIVVQRGIAGVNLGMTRATVRALLGPPPQARVGENDFGRYTEFIYPRVRVTFQGNRSVTAVRTTSRLERTARGVGVGSTEAQVRARVAGVRCRTEFGFRHCFVGRFLAGRRVTDFRIRRGRVTSVTVGFVID